MISVKSASMIQLYILPLMGVFKDHGFEISLVGGCVRDFAINKEPSDFDLTTNAVPQQIIKVFEKYPSFKVIPSGIDYGVVTINFRGESFEVATYRTDLEYDGRRPKAIKYSESLSEDLSRRDFRMNAMAIRHVDLLEFDLEHGNIRDIIFDPFDGLSDLDNKVIQYVGNPMERINDDKLRALRFVRFMCTMDLDFCENNTFEMYRSIDISNIAPERIQDEFMKIVKSRSARRGIMTLHNTGLLKQFMPELCNTMHVNQLNPYHDKTVGDHILDVFNSIPRNNPELRLAALFHDIGKPRTMTIDEDGIGHFYNHEVVSAKIAREIMVRLRFDNATIDKVCLLVENHTPTFLKQTTDCDDSTTMWYTEKQARRYINRVCKTKHEAEHGTILAELHLLQLADKYNHKISPIIDTLKINAFYDLCNRVIATRPAMTVKDLMINGHDLMGMGYVGVQIGEVLGEMLEMTLDCELKNEKEALLEFAQQYYVLNI